MPGKKTLSEYERKRDFSKTKEPKAGAARGGAKGTTSGLFVIQKHAASRLHYDLRLEIDGVLKSWAVPKGPSLDWQEKRLAVHVEDHPMDYADFEGTIPKGEYGGGSVMLWDRGTFRTESNALEQLESGTLKVEFKGERMQGWWVLVKMRKKGQEDADNWLLIKEKFDADFEDGDTDLTDLYETSIASGRTMDEITKGLEGEDGKSDEVWHSDRMVEQSNGRPKSAAAKRNAAKKVVSKVNAKKASNAAGKGSGKAAVTSEALPIKAKKKAMPKTIKPMLCTWIQEPQEGEEWVHEIKFDGYRILARIEEGEVKLLTRNDNDWTDRFGAIAKAVARLGLQNAVLDGEVVVVDAKGISDFGALQNHVKGVKKGSLVYYAFDLLHYEGHDLTVSPLTERKALLAEVLAAQGEGHKVVRMSDHLVGRGPEFLEQSCKAGLEGIISKRADSAYSPRRSRNWIKTKCISRQEFVIGGYTEPGGSRHGFGALVLGYHDEEGRLIYCGRVGTGFDQKTLTALHKKLQSRERKTSPFAEPPTGADAKGVQYVRPDLVCEIEFLAWTDDGRLRHPSFKGLRQDKKAAEVVREVPKTADDPGSGTANRSGKAKRAGSADGRTPKVKQKKKDNKSEAGPDVIEGIKISHPDRVIFAGSDLTKLDLARYMADCADWILPHVADRPLAVVRCPEGATKGAKGAAADECFFQKNYNDSMPAAVHPVDLGDAEGIGISDAAGLVALAQFGVIEIHPWGSREGDIERPDRLTFDLDPGPGLAWPDVVQGARDVRALLGELGLESWVKTSGGKGLHVVVPIRPELDWDTAKAFCRAVAEILEKQNPDRYVAKMSKAKRKGRIFVDYLRNGRGATSVAAYSPRAREGGPVSVTVRWDELGRLDSANGYTVGNIRSRLGALKGDPWEGFFEADQRLGKIVESVLGG